MAPGVERWAPLYIVLPVKLSEGSTPPADPLFEGRPVVMEGRAESHSKPGRVVSGNGKLLLTDEELVFEQRLPQRLIRIPRASITGVSTTKAVKLRIFPRLLRVEWTADSGPDWMVLTVKGIDEWIAALGQVR